MAIKELVPQLNQIPLDKITKTDVSLANTFRDMLETMQYHNLEYIIAPDIGVNQPLIAVDGSSQNFGVMMMINPAVVFDVENKLVIEYNNMSGKPQSVILVDKLASCVRHALYELGV
jgi:peptide deformylase